MSLIESKSITRDFIDVAKTESEAIQFVQRSLVNAGKLKYIGPLVEDKPGLTGNGCLYALILLKEEFNASTKDFNAASQISLLNAKYLDHNDPSPLMVYCMSDFQDENFLRNHIDTTF